MIASNDSAAQGNSGEDGLPELEALVDKLRRQRPDAHTGQSLELVDESREHDQTIGPSIRM